MASKQQLAEALKASVVPVNELNPWFKGLIYGESGVGKTVAALEIAQRIAKKKILYVDAVEGWVSLRNHPELMKNVVRMPYQGLSQLHTFSQMFAEGDEWALQFDAVVTDEISVIAELDLDNVLKASVQKDPSKDADVPVWPDMNAATHRVRRLTIEWSKLPFHQIYLSHLREDEDKAKGYKITRPQFMPKLSGTVRNSIHLVAYMKADERNVEGRPNYIRSLQVHPTKTVVAKSRIGGLGVHTTVSVLKETIAGWIGGEVEEIETQDIINDVSPDYLKDADPVIEVQ